MKISVLIAIRNAEKWIQRTLDSLKNQSYENWECIISLNDSSDCSENICRSMSDERFIFLKSDIANKSIALNLAIEVAKSDLLCILDADDLWHADKLKLQIERFQRGDVDICGTGLIYIDENDNELISQAPDLPCSDIDCKMKLFNCSNPIANSSVMYHKKIHDIAGLYDPEFNGIEDYEMWKRCFKNNLKFSNLKEKLLLHRIHSTSNFNSTKRQSILKQKVDELYANSR